MPVGPLFSSNLVVLVPRQELAGIKSMGCAESGEGRSGLQVTLEGRRLRQFHQAWEEKVLSEHPNQAQVSTMCAESVKANAFSFFMHFLPHSWHSACFGRHILIR